MGEYPPAVRNRSRFETPGSWSLFDFAAVGCAGYLSELRIRIDFTNATRGRFEGVRTLPQTASSCWPTLRSVSLTVLRPVPAACSTFVSFLTSRSYSLMLPVGTESRRSGRKAKGE